MYVPPRRHFRALPTGRPRFWTTELLIDAAREWQERYGALPRPTDWSTQRAKKLGGETFERLTSPPDCGPRWPAASTVNDVFGGWAQFHAECERVFLAPGGSADHPVPDADVATPGVAALQLLGDSDVIDDLRPRWRACTHQRDHGDEWRFVAWAVANRLAVLPNADVPTTGIAAVYWRLCDIAEDVGQVHVIFPRPEAVAGGRLPAAAGKTVLARSPVPADASGDGGRPLRATSMRATAGGGMVDWGDMHLRSAW